MEENGNCVHSSKAERSSSASKLQQQMVNANTIIQVKLTGLLPEQDDDSGREPCLPQDGLHSARASACGRSKQTSCTHA